MNDLVGEYKLMVRFDGDSLCLLGELMVWILLQFVQMVLQVIWLDNVICFDIVVVWYLVDRVVQGIWIEGLILQQQVLLDMVIKVLLKFDFVVVFCFGWCVFLECIGQCVVEMLVFQCEFVEYLGCFLVVVGCVICYLCEFCLILLVYYCQEIGLCVVFIVVLMFFLIGVVLVFQGVVQFQ